MSRYTEESLITVKAHQVFPGEDWAGFTAIFHRKKIDIQTLGSIAGNLVVRYIGHDSEADFRKNIANFGERARPPIYDQEFIRAAYETASIEDTLSQPKLESAA